MAQLVGKERARGTTLGMAAEGGGGSAVFDARARSPELTFRHGKARSAILSILSGVGFSYMAKCGSMHRRKRLSGASF